MRAGLAIAAVLCVFGVAGASQAQEREHIEWIECARFTALEESVRADCGFLRVPEVRGAANSRVISVAFLRMRSTAAAPTADALVMMPGGPGSRGIAPDGMARNPMLETRDVIWIEQRGAGLSEPLLDCPQVRAAERRAALGEVDGEGLARLKIAAARECAEAARQAGAALDGYTTLEMTADIEALRRLLGYEQFSLYGISYSGRVMTEMARDYPASVRAIVLNSPLPVEANYDEHASENVRAILDRVFEGCASSPACAAAAPELRTRYDDIVRRADRGEILVSVSDPTLDGGQAQVRLTGWSAANALTGQLYYPFTLERLPTRIATIHAGDWDQLGALVGLGGSDFAWLQRIAVWCNEEYPFESQSAIRRQVSDFPEFSGVDQATVPIGLCEASGFGGARPAPSENSPVQTSVPVLVFAGELDPVIPVAWLERMAAHMPNAQIVRVPGGGHGAGFAACGLPMTLAFLATPGPVVDACAGAPSEVDWTRAGRTAP
jgi:pimeloyl-ACP methyl ester carboxylesterase